MTIVNNEYNQYNADDYYEQWIWYDQVDMVTSTQGEMQNWPKRNSWSDYVLFYFKNHIIY